MTLDKPLRSRPLKLAIVVHGRFHAFDLARELIRQGVNLILLTNYPKYVAERFGIPRRYVVNCVAHGVLSRLVGRLGGARFNKCFEPFLHRWFSRWAGRVLSKGSVDAIHSFSGVSEELLKSVSGRCKVMSVVRGSAHIRKQARLLEEEEVRCRQSIDRPSAWRIEREEREYQLADLVFVLSSFARRSFEEEGVPPEKLRMIPLGSELNRFGASTEDIERRCTRILAGEPLRVLTVGSFSFRKGALDLAEIARRLSCRMKFRMVGDIESKALQEKSCANIEFVARMPQFSLPAIYSQADVFLFPTIEDGYAVVLAQAQAGGLPILATANCIAPDIVKEGENGWILPIRNPAAFVEKLEWCDANREGLAKMVRLTEQNYIRRDWANVAADILAVYDQFLLEHQV